MDKGTRVVIMAGLGIVAFELLWLAGCTSFGVWVGVRIIRSLLGEQSPI